MFKKCNTEPYKKVTGRSIPASSTLRSWSVTAGKPARQEVILAACIGFSEELFSRGDRSDSMELCIKWR